MTKAPTTHYELAGRHANSYAEMSFDEIFTKVRVRWSALIRENIDPHKSPNVLWMAFAVYMHRPTWETFDNCMEKVFNDFRDVSMMFRLVNTRVSEQTVPQTQQDIINGLMQEIQQQSDLSNRMYQANFEKAHQTGIRQHQETMSILNSINSHLHSLCLAQQNPFASKMNPFAPTYSSPEPGFWESIVKPQIASLIGQMSPQDIDEIMVKINERRKQYE